MHACVYIVLGAACAVCMAHAVYSAHQRHSEEARRRVPVRERLAILRELLGIVAQAGSRSGTAPFLLYGTLLGHARHRDFICYDFDVDVGVFQVHFDTFARAAAAAVDAHPDFRLSTRQFLGWRQLVIVHAGTGINVDVSEFMTDGRSAWRNVPAFYSTLSECSATYPLGWVLPLRRARMAGVDVLVPNKSHELLRCYYGNSYTVPDHVCDAACQNCAPRT